MATLGHATLGSNRLEGARAFYDDLLGSAGIVPLWEHPSGGRVHGTGESYFFCLLGPYDGKPATVGNGAMVAFRFDTRAEIDAFHARALTLRGVDEDEPGERAPGFYMSYFRDLDGNKLCAYSLS